jgi:hypothetical protein
MKIELSDAKAIITRLIRTFSGPARRMHFGLVRNDKYFAAAALKKWPILLSLPVAVLAALSKANDLDGEYFKYLPLFSALAPLGYFLTDSHFESKQLRRRFELTAKRLREMALVRKRKP